MTSVLNYKQPQRGPYFFWLFSVGGQKVHLTLVQSAKVTVLHSLLPPDCEARIQYCGWFQKSVFSGLVDPELMFYSGDTWFTLSGYVLPPDCEARIQYFGWFQESVFVKPELIFNSDEAWFTLSNYVNRKNSTENPHAFYIVPLHNFKRLEFGVQLMLRG
jgi:hypothetical protein